jgi:5-methyltetrahydrofolate--homocysteine methyltransferase
MSVPNSEIEQKLRRIAAERILVLDGAMATMIQELKLDEGGYRGARFDAWNREVRGNNDLLILTQPDAIQKIHLEYFRAGADIVSTNTFSSTQIAQADYGMQEIAHELMSSTSRAPSLRVPPPTSRSRRTAARASSPGRSGRPIARPRFRRT